MQVKRTATKWMRNEYGQNTYVVELKMGCIIIDAGAKVEDIKQSVGNCKVLGVLITHCHFDHILHIEAYQKAFDCPIYVSENSKDYLVNPYLNASALMSHARTFNVNKLNSLSGGEVLNFDDVSVLVLATPGHSDDSLCYLVESENEKILFSGDTLFARAVGRVDLARASKESMLESLEMLDLLDFDVAYPGHARKTTKEEQKENIAYWKSAL